MQIKPSEPLCVFLSGDVMTGRGVDQVLPHPGNPVLYESSARDAREYVHLAEARNGPIPRPVSFGYIWGDAAAEWRRAATDLKIINLETSITSRDDHWPRKSVHYRMHPQNIGCLTSATINACALANNHVLDWGYEGLAETLQVLDRAGVAHAGAGENEQQAAAPAVLNVPSKGRVLLYSFGSLSSGIPHAWAAAPERSGVNLLEQLSEATALPIGRALRAAKRAGDVAIASIHWGGNWGYDIAPEQVEFAHGLVKEGFDIIHGHSSHHVRPMEVFRQRLILYGCGDFITDYEGIRGYELFRGELALMYFVRVDPQSGELRALRMVPMQMRQFRLNHASPADRQWLAALLNSLGAPFGTRVALDDLGALDLQWERP